MSVVWRGDVSDGRLLHYCENTSSEIIVIQGAMIYPEIDIACAPHHIPGIPFNCPTVGADIQECRFMGKQIFLQLSPDNDIPNDEEARRFAIKLWDAFGPEDSTKKTSRPLNDAEVDGFLFSAGLIRSPSYVALANQLKELDEDIILGVSLECDASNIPDLSKVGFGTAYVIFSEQECGIEQNFNWRQWADYARTSPDPYFNFFVSIPGNLDVNVIKNKLPELMSDSSFGGFNIDGTSLSARDNYDFAGKISKYVRLYPEGFVDEPISTHKLILPSKHVSKTTIAKFVSSASTISPISLTVPAETETIISKSPSALLPEPTKSVIHDTSSSSDLSSDVVETEMIFSSSSSVLLPAAVESNNFTTTNVSIPSAEPLKSVALDTPSSSLKLLSAVESETSTSTSSSTAKSLLDQQYPLIEDEFSMLGKSLPRQSSHSRLLSLVEERPADLVVAMTSGIGEARFHVKNDIPSHSPSILVRTRYLNISSSTSSSLPINTLSSREREHSRTSKAIDATVTTVTTVTTCLEETCDRQAESTRTIIPKSSNLHRESHGKAPKSGKGQNNLIPGSNIALASSIHPTSLVETLCGKSALCSGEFRPLNVVTDTDVICSIPCCLSQHRNKRSVLPTSTQDIESAPSPIQVAVKTAPHCDEVSLCFEEASPIGDFEALGGGATCETNGTICECPELVKSIPIELPTSSIRVYPTAVIADQYNYKHLKSDDTRPLKALDPTDAHLRETSRPSLIKIKNLRIPSEPHLGNTKADTSSLHLIAPDLNKANRKMSPEINPGTITELESTELDSTITLTSYITMTKSSSMMQIPTTSVLIPIRSVLNDAPTLEGGASVELVSLGRVLVCAMILLY